MDMANFSKSCFLIAMIAAVTAGKSFHDWSNGAKAGTNGVSYRLTLGRFTPNMTLKEAMGCCHIKSD